MEQEKELQTNNINTLTAEKILELVKREFNPRTIKTQNDVFNYIFKTGIFTNNFIGGSNSKNRTVHENIFSSLLPYLEQQVTFGTGKGGYKKYLSNKFTVDFLDRKNKISYEIDGKNHENKLQQCKDKIKEIFLMKEYGIKTIRISNQEVENILLKNIKKKLQGDIICKN